MQTVEVIILCLRIVVCYLAYAESVAIRMKLLPRKNWFEALPICELCMPNVNLALQPRLSLNFPLHHRQPQNDVGTFLISYLWNT